MADGVGGAGGDAAAAARPPPAVFATLANTPALDEAMQTLDFELVCSAGEMRRVSEDDLFGYVADAGGPFAEMFTLCCEGTGGAWHAWGAVPGAPVDEWPVVFLGSEGARVKCGRTAAEFVQVACSLAPHLTGVLGYLPGVNTLPDNGDIAGAAAADFDRARVLELLQVWGPGEDEVVAAADVVLAALNLQRLDTAAAVDALLEAHLQNPRFIIEPED